MIAMYPHTQNIHCIYASFVVAVDGYTWEKEPCNVYILLAHTVCRQVGKFMGQIVWS